MRRLLAAVLLLAGAGLASAQSWAPSKPVHVVVGFPNGSLLDILARAIGDELRKGWVQPVVVENRPGADSIIAADAVAKAAGDGHTLFLGTLGALGLNPHLYRKLPYDPARDFAGVSFVAESAFGLAVNPEVKAATVPELIALAKASPGKLNYASGASFAQMVGEAFKRRAGVDLLHVPYKGVQPAVTEAIAGRAQVIFADIPSLVPSYKGGKLRLIGVTGSRRSIVVPEVPTIAEAGVAGYDYATWYAFVAPAATAKETIARLNTDLVAAMNSAAMKKRFLDLGLEPRPSDPDTVNRLVPAEIARWEPIVRGAGIQPQ